jgi:DNA polymerase I-like protein with 3'-5' exonuclease and polymerase domains
MKKPDAPLYFREDWKEIPAEIPVSQKHVENDELIVELPDDEKAIQEAADLVESLFNITVKGVPFKVDIAVGRSWACGKE